jgi:hypothetical protein
VIRILALLAIMATSTPAAADAVCAGIADTAALLAQEWFTPHSGGLIEGATVTVYVNPDGRWLALLVTGTQACVVSVGTGWSMLGIEL